MDIFLRLDEPAHRLFIGQRRCMSLAQDETFALWQGFMPLQKLVQQKQSADLYAIQVYKDNSYFRDFDISNVFEKWAAVPVAHFNSVPPGMETFVLPQAPYAVFLHRGTPADFPKTARFIFEQWLPASGYELDHRPHFEILGARYKNNSPNSEEEVWIPVKETPVSAAPAH